MPAVHRLSRPGCTQLPRHNHSTTPTCSIQLHFHHQALLLLPPISTVLATIHHSSLSQQQIAREARQFARPKVARVFALPRTCRSSRTSTKSLNVRSAPPAQLSGAAETSLKSITSLPDCHYDTAIVTSSTQSDDPHQEPIATSNDNASSSQHQTLLPEIQTQLHHTQRQNRDLQERQKLQAMNRELVLKRGRWLFSSDRPDPIDLDEEERNAQQEQMYLHHNLKKNRPGEYLYLCLMNLSRELRDLVWSAYTDNLPQKIIIHLQRKSIRDFSSPVLSISLPPLCYVNHQLFDECVPALLRHRTVQLGSNTVLRFNEFLCRLTGTGGFDAITHLVLEYVTLWSSERSNEVALPHISEKPRIGTLRLTMEELVSRMPALKELTYGVEIWPLLDPSSVGIGGQWMLQSAESLARAHPVEALSLCAKLKKFTLSCQAEYFFAHKLAMSTEQVFGPLVSCLRDQLASKAAHIEYMVTFRSADREEPL